MRGDELELHGAKRIILNAFFWKSVIRFLGNSCLSPCCGDISKIGMEYCKVN